MAVRKAKQQVIAFSGTLEKAEGRFGWTFVEFPHDVQELFGKRGAVRVRGTVNGVPMDRALMPTKSGYHVIVFGDELRRKAKVKQGDRVTIEVWLDPEPNKVDLPEELEETLAFLPEFKRGWDALLPGRQRNICIWIRQARTTGTRAKRVAELLRRFETGHAWFKKASKRT